MKRLALRLLNWYKRKISPRLPDRCRFYPSCSVYMREAVERFGFFRGVYLGIKRLLRCNPLFKGGMDPVPDRFRLFGRETPMDNDQ